VETGEPGGKPPEPVIEVGPSMPDPQRLKASWNIASHGPFEIRPLDA